MDDGNLVPYLLGLGRHAYVNRDLQRYARLHEVARALAARPDGEERALHDAAQLSGVDRTLAALLVAAVRECAASSERWPRLSDEAYFAVARAQGRLADFIAFWEWFVVPESSGLADAAKRHRLVGAHLLGLPDGDEREGVRLAILCLFEGTEERVSVGLAFCNNLRGADTQLHERASARLLLAAESGELARYHNQYVDLAAQVVAALGRWRIDAARPHLESLLRNPPASFSPLARAHLHRTLTQLAAVRR